VGSRLPSAEACRTAPAHDATHYVPPRPSLRVDTFGEQERDGLRSQWVRDSRDNDRHRAPRAFYAFPTTSTPPRLELSAEQVGVEFGGDALQDSRYALACRRRCRPRERQRQASSRLLEIVLHDHEFQIRALPAFLELQNSSRLAHTLPFLCSLFAFPPPNVA